MREIKFRVWDKKYGGWLKNVRIYENGSVASDGIWTPMKDIEVMQFTGMKDKNDVDIYEGDIVEIAGFGKYKVVYFPDSMKFFFLTLEANDKAFVANSPAIRVLGNEFEEPELVAKK